jgi:hypothetical protein
MKMSPVGIALINADMQTDGRIGEAYRHFTPFIGKCLQCLTNKNKHLGQTGKIINLATLNW